MKRKLVRKYCLFKKIDVQVLQDDRLPRGRRRAHFQDVKCFSKEFDCAKFHCKFCGNPGRDPFKKPEDEED